MDADAGRRNVGVIEPVQRRPVSPSSLRTSQLSEDGGAESAAVLAGLWTQWMRAATQNASAAALASMPLVPYAHQSRAVYGSMLPQPLLEFLLAERDPAGWRYSAGRCADRRPVC